MKKENHLEPNHQFLGWGQALIFPVWQPEKHTSWTESLIFRSHHFWILYVKFSGCVCYGIIYSRGSNVGYIWWHLAPCHWESPLARYPFWYEISHPPCGKKMRVKGPNVHVTFTGWNAQNLVNWSFTLKVVSLYPSIFGVCLMRCQNER